MANWGGRSDGPDFASLRRELAAGSFRPVYLLAGEDTHRAASIVEYLVNKLLGASGSAFNSHVFDGEQAGCDRILQQARSYPMFGDRQVIWVKRAEHMVGDVAAEQALQRYLAEPVAATTLILMSEKVDGRKSWVKACKTAGFHFEMAPPSGRDLVDWTVRRAKDKSLPLALELAEMLVELVGDDLHALDGELDKLALIAAEAKGGLDEASLRAVILEQRAIDPFELVKQLGPGRQREGLAAFHRFLSEGRSAFELAPLLIWRVKQVAQVAALRAEGQPEKAVPGLLGITPFAARQSAETARAWGDATVERALRACHRCEAAMKSSPLEPETILERAILEICAA